MQEFTVKLSDEEVKALLTNMVSIQTWLDNAIHNKARQCINAVCEKVVADDKDSILTKDEKEQIHSKLTGNFFLTPSNLPDAIKAEIVSKARVETAAERNAEWIRSK